MKRIDILPRPNWEQKVEGQGFIFYKDNSYYSETAAYEFTGGEIALIEKASGEIQAMCLEVVDHVIKNELWDDFFIPAEYRELVKWSWEKRQPSFYGRLDLALNKGELKLLEYNADTPTLLLESGVIQWFWLQDFNKDLDQYNNIHESLVAHIKSCLPNLLPGKLYFSGPDNAEDFMTVKYLQDAAAQSGAETAFVFIDDISLDENDRFTDAAGDPISNIFKLYPYEWLFNEPFGKYLVTNKDNCLWIEPAYKLILSCKTMLRYLYELFPDSPYILPCIQVKSGETCPFPQYAKKPVYSREGANVSLVLDGEAIEETGGEYGEEGYIYQAYTELPEFSGMHPIIGSWIIGGKPAGLGIRESPGRITNNSCSFCPHYIAE
jgi:glutathionylspermidine synthase